MAKATKVNCKNRHALPTFISCLLYTGASQHGKKQEFKNYLVLFCFFHIGSYKLLKAFMEASKDTMVWARKTRTDWHQPPAGTWARLNVSPSTLAPQDIQPRWGWILLDHPAAHLPWISSSRAHPRCAGAVRRIPELCRTRGSLFCCGDISVGGPKATAWELSDKKDLCMKENSPLIL